MKLNDLLLCDDCDSVVTTPNVCPVCQSSSLFPVARLGQGRRMKVGITGPALSGKDTLASMLEKVSFLKGIKSCSDVIFDHIKLDPFYFGWIESDISADRKVNRALWKKVGDDLRAEDPAFLVREAMKTADIVTGIRDKHEMLAALPHLDAVIYVMREGTVDSTCNVLPGDADFVVLNDSTLEDLEAKVKRIAHALGVLKYPRINPKWRGKKRV